MENSSGIPADDPVDERPDLLGFRYIIQFFRLFCAFSYPLLPGFVSHLLRPHKDPQLIITICSRPVKCTPIRDIFQDMAG